MAIIDPIVVPDTEEECIEALKAARWPGGNRCPRCDGAEYYEITGRRLPLYECADCRYQYSVISGTIMERSRVPLRKWFQAIDIMARLSVTAKYLSVKISVTYKTAWLMLHKLREAMSDHNETQLLAGLVRLETGIAGRQPIPALHGLHQSESPFIIGGEMDGDGRVRRVAVCLDEGGDTYRRHITAQGARRFVERYADMPYAVVDLATDEYGRMGVQPLRELAYGIEQEAGGYSVNRKNLNYYIQAAVFRYNSRLAGSVPSTALLQVAASRPAPTVRAVQERPVPGLPIWRTERHIRHLAAELLEYGRSLLAQAAMNFRNRSMAAVV